MGNWRSPLANGSVAEFFETEAFEWPQATYEFLPYYWTASERWKELMEIGGGDAVFEKFLKAGSASVVVPVWPGMERSVILFLKTGLIWRGGYLPLFTSADMLEVYADVELAQQLDPPEQVREPWEIRVLTSLIMLQKSSELPTFDDEEEETVVELEARTGELLVDQTVPFLGIAHAAPARIRQRQVTEREPAALSADGAASG